jgi:hypothetical protein
MIEQGIFMLAYISSLISPIWLGIRSKFVGVSKIGETSYGLPRDGQEESLRPEEGSEAGKD